MNYTDLLLKDGFVPFGRNLVDSTNTNDENQRVLDRLSKLNLKVANDTVVNHRSEPAFYVLANAAWHEPESVGFSGWKIDNEDKVDENWGKVYVVFETSWYHSIQLEDPRTFVGGPFRAAVADYLMGMCSLFQQGRFCPIISMDVTYEKSIRVGEVLESILTDIGKKEDGKFTQHGIQRIYGTDKTIGTIKTVHKYPQLK